MTRKWIVGTALALVGTLGVSLPATVQAGSAAAATGPSNLAVLRPKGSVIQAGKWVGKRHVTFRFTVTTSGEAVTPQVEVVPLSTPFTGRPTVAGTLVPASTSASSSVSVTVSSPALADGRYRWRARVVSPSGASPWVAAGSGGMEFGVDTARPTAPTVTSPTVPDGSRPTNARRVALRWASTDAISGIRGYVYAVRHVPSAPRGHVTATPGATVGSLADGVWYVSVRARDRAGNWSPARPFRLTFDRTAPRVTWIGLSRTTFAPSSPVPVQFKLDSPASVRLSVYRIGSKTPVATLRFPAVPAGAVQTATWNGKTNAGKAATPGKYFFGLQAIDAAGNLARSRADLIAIALPVRAAPAGPTPIAAPAGGGKHIIVSLSRQSLYAFDGPRLVLSTYVTTGNPALPTPVGSYSVMTKQSPFEFISPWPPGSPYWYPPSWSTYAMLFRSGGYYLHDAPWRSAFGPHTNDHGAPGTNYGGSHGCVNIPPVPMRFLWSWTTIGTRVDVVP